MATARQVALPLALSVSAVIGVPFPNATRSSGTENDSGQFSCVTANGSDSTSERFMMCR